ncbi:hypothetical protein [Pelagicoccus sp. SDUM812003]|uniref:hypothetical protein n=1 Tax=Pelagicoccus sp. SDUM812003 TaxID=3041267 RepID=UPI0028103A1E|nr:hypothetical protein [Pelagicoccus sp. SDUM812003]MDQ8204427.1 hypothetical protein [Pelagicoccus sp. SDUM812003]
MKSLCFLLSLIAIVLGALLLKQRQTIASLEAEIAALAEAPSEQSDANKTNAQAAPATPQASSANAPAPVAQSVSETEEDDNSSNARMMRDISKMMENPQMNEVMQASQRATLEVLYKDYLNSLDLTPEERSHFMDILMARQMFRVETSMKMMGGVSDEERRLLSEEMQEYDETIGEEIGYFLNDDEDLAEWEFYERTMQERMSLSSMKASLAQREASLSREAERALIEIMADQRANYDFQSDLADQQNYDMGPERFSDENIDRYADDLKAVNRLIEQEASGILTEEQLAALVESLTAMSELQLNQLKMAANMFKNRK